MGFPDLFAWDIRFPAVKAYGGEMGKPADRRARAVHTLQVVRKYDSRPR
jgi:hypothetical protein